MLKRFLALGVLLFVVFGSLAVIFVKGETSETLWSQSYGSYGYEIAYDLAKAADGGYVMVGKGRDIANGGCWIVKTDAQGNMEWNKTYGGIQEDIGYAIIATADGGYAIAGSTESFGARALYSGSHDMWLIKTDAQGNMEWNKTYGEQYWEKAYAIAATSDGGYILAGEQNISPSGNFWVVKTDGQGNMEWNKTYGGDLREIAYSVVEASDGGYAVAGYTWSFTSAGKQDFWLVKTDGLGNVEWNQTYGGPGFDVAYSLISTSDGGYAIAGQSNSFGTGDDDFWLVKTDVNGNMMWNKKYGSTESEGAYALIETSDGGYAIAGYANADILQASLPIFTQDGWLVKTDANGNVEWHQMYGNVWDNKFRSVVEVDGGYVLAGNWGTYNNPEDGDFWLIKVNEYGSIPELPPLIGLTMIIGITLTLIILRRKRSTL